MSDGINIEVVGKFKERYPAKIHSFAGDNELIVKFNDSPDVLCKVPYINVYLLSENLNENKTQDYQIGCDVLALRKFDECNTCTFQFNDIKFSQAYWPAKIEKLKGGFAAVQFITKDNEVCKDLFELSTLRLMSDSRPLLRSDIHIHEIVVPDDLCEFCEHYDIRVDLIRWCGSAIIVNFDKKNKKLQIFSTEQEVVRKASVLDISFMRLLRQKKLVQKQKDELTRRLHDSIKNQFTEEFTVCDELMGLAIGHLGCNIKKAREIEGVINIDLNDHTHTFVISAQTQEACKAARAQLEYKQKIFYVPMDIVSKVIGKNGNQIQDIINQSGIHRVKVVEGPDLEHWIDEDNKSKLTDHVPFIFSGNAGSLSDAQLLLEFHIESHREMDQLQKKRDELEREYRNYQLPSHVANKFANSHNAMDREDEHVNNWPSRGYNSGARNRGRNNYKNETSSDVDQRNDSYNDDQQINQQKYRGGNGGRPGPYRRGGGSFRQASLPPAQNGQPKGNRRFQQYDNDSEEYEQGGISHDSENVRGGYSSNNRYRGNKSRGSNRGGNGNNGNRVANNTNQAKSPSSTLKSGPAAMTEDSGDQYNNGYNNQHNHHQPPPPQPQPEKAAGNQQAIKVEEEGVPQCSR